MGAVGIEHTHRFRIDRITVTGHDGSIWFDSPFHDGVNVIYGLNESGKTPLLLLIRRALGMEEAYKPQLKSLLLSMDLTFSVDSDKYLIHYNFRDVSWHLYLLSPTDGQVQELITNDQMQLQRHLLERLGLNEERVPDSTSKTGYKTVGLPNLFAAWYVNQKSGYSTIINDHDQKIRRIIFETQLGLDLRGARTRLEFLEKIMEQRLVELHKEELHYQNVKYKLELSEESEIKATLASEMEALAVLEDQYASLQSVEVPASHVDVAEGLRGELEVLQRKLNAKTFERGTVQEALANSKSDLRVAQGRLKELNQVGVAEEILSAFGFTQCPRCSQPITPDMQRREAAEHAHCMLCNRELQKTDGALAVEVERERNRLESEIQLQSENLRVLERQLHTVISESEDLQRRSDDIREQLARLTNVGLQPKLESLAELHSSIARSRMRIYQLELKIKFRELLEPVEAEIAGLKKHVNDAREEFVSLERSPQGNVLAREERTTLKLFLTENQRFIDGMFRDRRKFDIEETGTRIYMPRLNNNPFSRLDANEPYRVVIAYYLSLLAVSLQRPTRFPRFVVFDTPRQQDADPEILDSIVKVIRSFEERFGLGFQVIITGSDEAITTAASSSHHVIRVPEGKKIFRPHETE